MRETGSGFAFLPPEWAEEASSTNDALKARLASASPPPSGTVFAARRQTKGKGRLGNAWLSAPAGDLTFSFLWRGRASLDEAGCLSLACGLAVRDFLAELGIEAGCKWPNDVFVGDAKICGILIEGGLAGGGGPGGELALVVGIGVNLRGQAERDAALGRKTASVEQCLGAAAAPEALLPPLLRRLALRIASWRDGGFAALRADMEEALWGRGRPARARTPQGVVEGVVAGVGEQGELLLETGDKETIPVRSLSALDGVYAGNHTGNAL